MTLKRSASSISLWTIEPREITPRVIREDRYGGLKH